MTIYLSPEVSVGPSFSVESETDAIVMGVAQKLESLQQSLTEGKKKEKEKKSLKIVQVKWLKLFEVVGIQYQKSVQKQ